MSAKERLPTAYIIPFPAKTSWSRWRLPTAGVLCSQERQTSTPSRVSGTPCSLSWLAWWAGRSACGFVGGGNRLRLPPGKGGVMNTGPSTVLLNLGDLVEAVALAGGSRCSKHDPEGRNEGRQEKPEDLFAELNTCRFLTTEAWPELRHFRLPALLLSWVPDRIRFEEAATHAPNALAMPELDLAT